MRAALVIAAALLATSCAGPRALAGGGRPWRELRSEHVVLATDLPEDEADVLSEQLEVMLDAVLRGLFDVPPRLPATLPVVAFADVEDFRAFAPPPFDGYFALRAGGGGVLVTRGDFGRVTQGSVVAHEMTHFVTAAVLPRAPRWVVDGLATYMEGAGEGRRGELLRVGAPPMDWLKLAVWSRVPLRELFAAADPMDVPQCATSWLLVHFLLAEHRERFVAYELRLVRGEDPEAAWRAEFPEWDPSRDGALDRLDAAMTRYAGSGRYVETRFTARGEGAFRSRALGAEEVRGLLATLPRHRRAERGPR